MYVSRGCTYKYDKVNLSTLKQVSYTYSTYFI